MLVSGPCNGFPVQVLLGIHDLMAQNQKMEDLADRVKKLEEDVVEPLDAKGQQGVPLLSL